MPKRNWKKDSKLTDRAVRLAQENNLLTEEQRNKLDVYVSGSFKNTYGLAYNDIDNDRVEIALSFNYLKANEVEWIDKLIKHELVHWDVGIEQGHNLTFKHRAREVGTVPKHCMLEPDSGAEYEWKVRCNNCHEETGYYRRPKWISSSGTIKSRRICNVCDSTDLEVIETPFS